MSVTVCVPPTRPEGNRAPGGAPAAPTAVEFRYTQTESFVEMLHGLGASLLVTTYQANKLLAVRAHRGGLSTRVRTFEQPMGLAADARRLALGTSHSIMHFGSCAGGSCCRRCAG
jgi:Domain of unknown function (DUF4915)